MSSLARKKRNFIIVALIIPTVLLICFVVFPAIDLFKMSFYQLGRNLCVQRFHLV